MSESYPPQTAQKVDNWFVAPVSGPTNKVTMAWNGTGGGMDLTCTIPISSGQSEMGIAIGVATPTHETYTIRFSVDLNNAGTLQAKVIRYNSSSHTTYTTLTTMTVDASSNYQINFTGTGDSAWLWIGKTVTAAYTSKDGLIWNKDARYQYYHHGPLAKLVIGDQQVQGIDYAYTING